jgi:hypothetical protein
MKLREIALLAALALTPACESNNTPQAPEIGQVSDQTADGVAAAMASPEPIRSLETRVEDSLVNIRNYLLEAQRKQSENPFGSPVEDHVAFALGDIEVDGVSLLNELSKARLTEGDRGKYFEDQYSHNGHTLLTLLRSTNANWDREFEIQADQPDQFLTLTLREIVKLYLTNAPMPSIDGKHNWTKELRPDEWVLGILNHAMQDLELRQFVERKGIRYWKNSRWPRATESDYRHGVELEWEVFYETHIEGATCYAGHAEEALMLDDAIDGNSESLERYLAVLISRLEEINGEEPDRPVGRAGFALEMGHRLDTLAQTNNVYPLHLSADQLAVVRESTTVFTSVLETLVEQDEMEAMGHGTGVAAHAYRALQGVRDAGWLK